MIPTSPAATGEIGNEAELKTKIDVLDALMNIEACKETLGDKSLAMTPYQQYSSLGLEISPLKKTGAHFKLVTEYEVGKRRR